MNWLLVFSIFVLASLIQGCSQDTPELNPSAEILETPSVVPSATSLPTSAGITTTEGSEQVPRNHDLKPDKNGVYRFMVDGRITEPRVLKRGTFDNERFIGKRGPGGSVVAEMVIDVDGTVRDVKLLHGVDPEIDESFLTAAKDYLFEPATLDGEPVPVKYILILRIEVY